MAQIGLLEDNTRIAKLCAMMLQYAGHHVIVYEHPRACLDALLLQPVVEGRSYSSNPASSLPLPLDVLILDLCLPDISGLEVVTTLRSQPLTQQLPLIFCTAAATSEIGRALRVAPQATIIGKPFKFEDLTSAVTRALNPSVK